MNPEIVASVRFLLDQIVTGVPGVTGALVSTVDGFAVADRVVLPPRSSGGTPTDAQGLAAMSAALLGVANRMLAALGDQPASELTAGSPAGHVLLCRIGTTAVLTVVTGPTARLDDVEVVAREVAAGIHRLVTEPRVRPSEAPAPPAAMPLPRTAPATATAPSPWGAPSEPPTNAGTPSVGAR